MDIWPGASYAFTFDERGFWRFHNHNNPEEGGLIVVLGGGGGPPPQPLVMTIPDTEFETPGNVPFDDYVGLFSNDLLMTQYIVRYGPQNTVHLLKEAEGLISVDCHQRAHTLGRLAFEEYGAAAFALSGHECQAGSFHGATEALFAERGTANLEADVAAICSAAENPFFRHQCVHGVGHGLMAWTTYEINDALPFCDRMSTEADKGSCYSGVFMENVVGGLTGVMGHTTEYLRDDDPHFPCDAVESRYVVECYFYQTSHMLVVFGYDYSKVADACGEVPEHAQLNCYAATAETSAQQRARIRRWRFNTAITSPSATIAPCASRALHRIDSGKNRALMTRSPCAPSLTTRRRGTGATERSLTAPATSSGPISNSPISAPV